MPEDFDFDLHDDDVVEDAPSAEVPEPETPAPAVPASDVELQFDPDYKTDEKSVVVSVAGLAPREIKTDGSKFKVPADEAALLVQSPAVKEAN